jgi:lambda family phage portal protein
MIAAMFNRILRPAGRRSIEAGGGGRRWTGVPMSHAPQTEALAARVPAAARARAAYTNNPLAHRAVEAWAAALIGRGWPPQSQHPDRARAAEAQDDFEAMAWPLLVPAARALVRDGECFILLSAGADGRLRPRLLPAEQVDGSLTQDLGGGRRIVSGVELDADGEPLVYHILPDAPGSVFGNFGPPRRVPAADVIHVFDPLFPGQVRGLPWLTPALLKLTDYDASSDALLMLLKTSALMTGFVVDPEGGAAGLAGDGGSGAVDVSLEPGAMRVLPMGAQVTFSNPPSGLQAAGEFLRGQQREIAVALGLTYEALTGDLSSTNYSSARVGLLEFRRLAELRQKTLIEGQLLRPLWRRWIEAQQLAGALDADPAWLRVRFVAPGWQWVDPAREVGAEVEAINAGLKSRAEVIAARGRDIGDVDAEIAADGFAPRAAAPARPAGEDDESGAGRQEGQE